MNETHRLRAVIGCKWYDVVVNRITLLGLILLAYCIAGGLLSYFFLPLERCGTDCVFAIVSGSIVLVFLTVYCVGFVFRAR